MRRRLVEGLDYYREGGKMIYTSSYLRRRGYCCNTGCPHCPYRSDEDGARDEVIPVDLSAIPDLSKTGR